MLSKRDLISKLEQIEALIKLLKEKQQGELNLSSEDLRNLLNELERRVKILSAEAEEVERASIWLMARRRTFVLAITTLIELGVAAAILPFEKTIAKYAAIYAFAPLVSAVSGNYGLQTAAIIIRAMAVGTLTDKIKAVLREFLTALICGLLVGLFAGLVAWYSTGYWVALLVVSLALLAGMITAGLMGAIFPQVAKFLGFDPAVVAGPAETAFQDFASYVTFLLALTLLSRFFQLG